MRGDRRRTWRGVAACVAVAASSVGAVVAAAPADAIVGGFEVDQPTFESTWPFAVALFDHGSFYCTGSLVSPRVVVTAATASPPPAPPTS